MISQDDTDYPALFRTKIGPRPENPFLLEFSFLDGDVDVREKAVGGLVRILTPLKPNFLIGFAGYMSPVILAASFMRVGFDQMAKIWDKDPAFYTVESASGGKPQMIGVRVNVEKLKEDEANLGVPLEPVFIDDMLHRGVASEFAIRELHKHFNVKHAVFWTEVPGAGGREKLQSMGVSVHSLTTFSPETGFGPGISPDIHSVQSEASAFNTISDNQAEKREHHKNRLSWFPNRPVSMLSQSHANRPGGRALSRRDI